MKNKLMGLWCLVLVGVGGFEAFASEHTARQACGIELIRFDHSFVVGAQKPDSVQSSVLNKESQEDELRKQTLIQKYGSYYGALVADGTLELGMTREMCQEVIDLTVYDVGKSRENGHLVETWLFNKDKQDLQLAAAMSQLSGEEAMLLALFAGLADTIGVTPKYTFLVFTDGELTGLY